MKKIISIVGSFLITFHLPAQDCKNFLYLQKGKTVEQTSYNAKGEITIKTILTVSNVGISNDTITANCTKQMQFFLNNKIVTGKLYTSTYKCVNGVILIGMMPNPGQNKEMADQINSGYTEYPPVMQIGDHLKDASGRAGIGTWITIDEPLTNIPGWAGITSVPEQLMIVNSTNRMVEGKESVTTPAGTWDCFKITFQSTVQTIKPGKDMSSSTGLCTIYYAPNFGIIKFVSDKGWSEVLTAVR